MTITPQDIADKFNELYADYNNNELLTFEELTLTQIQQTLLVLIGENGTGGGSGTDPNAIPLSEKGSANGVATLDNNTLIPDAQIPSTITRDSELNSHTTDTNNPHSTTAAQVGAIPTSDKGAANGVATLDSNSKLPNAQLPDNITVTSILVTQGTTSEIDASSPPDNRLFLDTTKNRLRVGNDDYAKLSEASNSSISISYTGTLQRPILLLLGSCVFVPQAGTVTAGVGIVRFDISSYSELVGEPSLETITFNNIVSIEESFLGVVGLSQLVSVSAPLLKYVGGNFLDDGNNISPGLSLLSLIDVPALEYIEGYATVSDTLTSLTTISLPSLKFVGIAFQIFSPYITSVSLPSLEYIGGLYIDSSCSSISLPSLKFSMNNIDLANSGATKISTFSFGSNFKRLEGWFTATGQALNVTSVNNILVTLAALDGTNGTTAFSGSNRRVYLAGGTNAAPTGAGLTAKSTLLARGCQVFTN